MTKPRKKGRGRPEAENPKRKLISFRIDDGVEASLEKIRAQRYGSLEPSLSDVARALMVERIREVLK